MKAVNMTINWTDRKEEVIMLIFNYIHSSCHGHNSDLPATSESLAVLLQVT